jgi:hypothetical protein
MHVAHFWQNTAFLCWYHTRSSSYAKKIAKARLPGVRGRWEDVGKLFAVNLQFLWAYHRRNIVVRACPAAMASFNVGIQPLKDLRCCSNDFKKKL